jgi:hypothetical protein
MKNNFGRLKGLGTKRNWLAVYRQSKSNSDSHSDFDSEDRNRIRNPGDTKKVLEMDQNGLHFWEARIY